MIFAALLLAAQAAPAPASPDRLMLDAFRAACGREDNVGHMIADVRATGCGPGWREGMTLEINHVPGDSALRERFGLSGNIMVAQAIGGF